LTDFIALTDDYFAVAEKDIKGHYCPVIERAKMPTTPVVIDDYRSLGLLTI